MRMQLSIRRRRACATRPPARAASRASRWSSWGSRRARSSSKSKMSHGRLFGNMATSAVNSALLAEAGFTGDVRILDAEDGIHYALSKDPRAESARDLSAMTRDYGARWLIMDSGLKRYPSGTHNQQALYTVDRMVRELGIDPT